LIESQKSKKCFPCCRVWLLLTPDSSWRLSRELLFLKEAKKRFFKTFASTYSSHLVPQEDMSSDSVSLQPYSLAILYMQTPDRRRPEAATSPQEGKWLDARVSKEQEAN